MRYPNCQIENLGIRKFCRECGRKLSAHCENIPKDKLRGECGQRVQRVSQNMGTFMEGFGVSHRVSISASFGHT